MSQSSPSSRQSLMVANWKMNKNIAETESFVKEFLSNFPSTVSCEVVICPPSTSLASLSQFLKGTPVMWGAQNMNENSEGAFTGEISAGMLTSLGCKYVILGHSERRQIFGESDIHINKKIIAALNNGLIPIVCVGETLQEREAGQTLSIVSKQVKAAFNGIPSTDTKKMVIAYEPVWAIGTGKTATLAQAQEVHLAIRDILKDQYGSLTSLSVRILYGGSVKPENVSELMSCEDIDGGLVGGASLKADSFLKLVTFEKANSVGR
ncbi:MAG: triose-phosphate isomerase [Elusimicrobiota bacterium]